MRRFYCTTIDTLEHRSKNPKITALNRSLKNGPLDQDLSRTRRYEKSRRVQDAQIKIKEADGYNTRWYHHKLKHSSDIRELWYFVVTCPTTNKAIIYVTTVICLSVLAVRVFSGENILNSLNSIC